MTCLGKINQNSCWNHQMLIKATKYDFWILFFGAPGGPIKHTDSRHHTHTDTNTVGRVELIRLFVAKITLNPDYEAEDGLGLRAATYFVRWWWNYTVYGCLRGNIWLY